MQSYALINSCATKLVLCGGINMKTKVKDVKVIDIVNMCKKQRNCYQCPLHDLLPCGYEYSFLDNETLEKEIDL